MVCRQVRVCSTLQSFLPIFMITYFLLLMILLLKVPKEMVPNIPNKDPTSLSAYMSYTSEMRSPLIIPNEQYNKENNYKNRLKLAENELLLRNVSDKNKALSRNTTTISDVTFQDPRPLSIPNVTRSSSGIFYKLNDDIFIYSAYFDDRKEETFIRFLILAKQTASRKPLFCYFQDEIYNVTRTASRYEMCENHNKNFGGFIFSCQVPEFLNSPLLSSRVIISYNDFRKKFAIPLTTVRPPKHKLKFLDSYIGENIPGIQTHNENTYSHFLNNYNTNNKNQFVENSEVNSDKSSNFNHDKFPSASFAVCVPPLFGDISPHRLIEFVELTLVLGAQHIFFYKYDISQDIEKVLSHYLNKGVVTVTSWSLPGNVTSDKVWYNGQLLVHNDCLYRSMPRFDLVAFNDIDEFIVSHDNDSTAWSRVFPQLISNSTCGFSFRSAFYDPGVKNMRDTKLRIPKLDTRTKQFSKARSKVMLVPWRVFEVGIHHISKQNKENWIVRRVGPDTAFLHHYRRCVDSYDMPCGLIQRDHTITKRYYLALKKNFDLAVSSIFPDKDKVAT